jgi:hypothetical protein
MLLYKQNAQTTNNNPGLDYQCADPEHLVKGVHPNQVDELMENLKFTGVTLWFVLRKEIDILQTVYHNDYDQDPYAREFGLKKK